MEQVECARGRHPHQLMLAVATERLAQPRAPVSGAELDASAHDPLARLAEPGLDSAGPAAFLVDLTLQSGALILARLDSAAGQVAASISRLDQEDSTGFVADQ